jgi:hypothetical protein
MSKDSKTKKPFKPYPESKLHDPIVPWKFGEMWVTLDGQVIPIVNLRYSHLINIIAHVKKRAKATGMLPYLEEELKRRKKLELTKKTKAGKLLYGC